jgi:hypothetical protein
MAFNWFAVLVAIAVSVGVERSFAFDHLWALLVGLLAYAIARYVGYAVRVRRQISSDFDEAARAVARGRSSAPPE